MLAYYLSEEIGDIYTIYKQVQLKDNAIGLVSYHPQIIQLIKSFKMHNRDAMNIIVSNASKIARVSRYDGWKGLQKPHLLHMRYHR